MKTRSGNHSCRGLTLVEVLVCITILLLAVFFLLPLLADRSHRRSPRIECVNNLKQVGLSFAIWANDHGNKFPMLLSQTNGGSMEYTTGPNVFRHFETMSNEISSPKTVFCAAESDRWRKCAEAFGEGVSNRISFASNTNVSYFVGVDADQTPSRILSGDHNITNSLSVVNGILTVTTNGPAGWADTVHRKVGNITMGDGSVQQVDTIRLRQAIADTGLTTNRLQMP